MLGDLLGDLLVSLFGGDLGASRRRAKRRAALLAEGSSEALRKTERWGWVGGVLHAEVGELSFRSEGVSSSLTLRVRSLGVADKGPAMFGPTVLLDAVLESGQVEQFAVPTDAAPVLVSRLGGRPG